MLSGSEIKYVCELESERKAGTDQEISAGAVGARTGEGSESKSRRGREQELSGNEMVMAAASAARVPLCAAVPSDPRKSPAPGILLGGPVAHLPPQRGCERARMSESMCGCLFVFRVLLRWSRVAKLAVLVSASRASTRCEEVVLWWV